MVFYSGTTLGTSKNFKLKEQQLGKWLILQALKVTNHTSKY
jgi:hypothetical protein